LLLLPLADGQKEKAAALERHPAAVVRRRLAPGSADEDLLQVAERLAVKLRPGERCCRQAVLACLGVGEVEPLVLREPWMQGDLEETAEDLRAHGRHAGNRRRIERAVADNPELAA